ncbi:csm1-like protein [Eutypa lata]|nr:csm1-like protein [Eutypa lata]
MLKSEQMASKAKPKKRSRDDDDGSRRKRRKGGFEQDELLFDTDAGVNRAIGLMDSQLMADHIAQKTSRFGTDLSPVELSDLYISPNSIRDSTSFQEIRSLDNLPQFLEKHSETPERLGQAPKQNGSPHTIIVTGAGLRAADLVRAVRKYQKKGNSVAKLFAKHIKIEESTQFLKTHRTGIAVGTPKRLGDLVENGSLSLDNLERLVVDASHIDQKKRGVLDMKDTMMELARWLTRREFKERYTDSEKPLQLLFY